MDPALQQLLDKQAITEVIARYSRTLDWLDDEGQATCYWPDAQIDYGFFSGTATDFLTPPLSPFELLLGFGLGAATRGLFVGLVTAACVWPFSRYGVEHLWAIAFFSVVASLLLGLMGVMAGLWSEKFDQLAAVQNFLVMPMTFLSGTFYAVEALPEPFATISHFNPFFYLIDGFRYGFIGQAEGDLTVGIILSIVLTVIVGWVAYEVFRRGWRLKS